MKDRTRKICSVLLTLTLFVGILLPMGAAPAQAATVSKNPAGFAYEANGDGTIEIMRLPNDYFNTGIADIPTTIDGQKVTALAKGLFVSGLSEVTVPGTVAEIPDYLFWLDNQGSDGLKKVVLEDGVKKIGRESFAFQVGLSSVTLSNALTEIGGSAFQGCTALSRIDLSSSLTTIGGSAFMSSGLTAVVLPDRVREVGAQAFRNCSKLQSVTLSSGMTTISARLFEGADKLTTVTIPASIRSIGEDAFNGCDSLKTIYFGGTQAQWNELTSYPNMASQGNEILKNVKVIFANGESSDPSTPTEPEDTAIPVPVDLTAESTVDGVQLSWSIPLEVGDVKWEYDEFVVVRELANGTGSEIGRTSRGVYSYLDKDVKDGESYTYIVCALKDGAESGGFSKEVSITYDANPFTTTTIRDTAIRIGNQEDGKTGYRGIDKLWLSTGAQGMRIDLIFPEEMDELKNQTLSVTVSGGGETFQGTAVEYIGQQVSFTLALTGGKHLAPNTTYTVAVKDARGNTIAQTSLQSAGRETASWGFTNKDASYSLSDLERYYPASIAGALYDLDKSHGEDGLCFGMALAGALWQQGEMPRISGGHDLLNTVSWSTTLASGQWQGASVEDYIKACNALQFSQPYAKQTRDNRDDYDGLVRAVKSGEPVIIGTWINGMEGHAVLAYDYKEDSSNFTIYVQDPQCMPYQISTLTLKGSSGHWRGWSYQRRSWQVDSSGAEDPNRYFSWRSATTTPDDDFCVDSVLVDAGENIKYNIENDLDHLWHNLVGSASVTPISGTSAAWLEGTETLTMNGLTDEIVLADSTLSLTARGTNARVALAHGIDAVTLSGSGTLSLSVEAEDVTLAFSGTAASGVTLSREGDSLTLSGAESGSVTIREDGATTTTTTITPGQDVRVTLDGELGEAPESPAGELSYHDVRASDWFYEPVKFVSEQGLMTGTAPNTFAPNLTTTRGMIVSILYRLEGGPQIAGSSPFTDVKDDDWYGDAVRWAERAGVVSGTSATTFAPNAAITREQLAAILMNYANYRHENTSARADLSKYSDAGKISSWANDVMAWAVSKGYISGMTATTLAPQGSATRAQVAAILQRYLAD